MHRFLLLLSAAILAAQTPEENLRRMLASKQEITAYLVKEARRITGQTAAEIASRESWEKVRDMRRREMRDMLGLDPWPARTPLNVRITGRIDKPDYTIEKIAFESLPKVYVTGNLYVPKKRDGRLPTIVYVCGHTLSPHGAKAVYQRHSITFAKNGYVCFILDPIQIAETFALHHGVMNQEMYDWYARGYTPAGVEVWNALRAADYLETRPEVDRNKMGITGRSGGAAMSWFAGAVDERFKVVVPVMGISTYAANVAAITPRPLFMVHGKKDVLFPVPGYEELEQRVGALYGTYGQRDRFRNLVVDTAHADSDLLRGEAIKWFDRWLKDIPPRDLALDYTDEPAASLAVFGGNPPADAQNFRVHETFTARQKRPDDLAHTLREKVFRAFPANPPPLDIRATRKTATGSWQDFDFTSEDGITVRAVWRPSRSDKAWPALLYVASDGEDPGAFEDTLRQTLSNR